MQTQTFELPSKGYFYDEDNPLSSGELEIRPMLAKDEDLLTDQSLARREETLDKLLENVIQTDFDMDTMLVGDKSAAIVATRILGYGPQYSFNYQDPLTGNRRKKTINLREDIDEKDVPFEKFEKTQKRFSFELPFSGRDVEFRLLRHKDDAEIRFAKKKMEQAGQASPNVTLRLKKQIVELDGEDDNAMIASFVDNEMIARDSRALRQYIDEITPDLDLTIEVASGDGGVDTVPINIEPEFFFPSKMEENETNI